MERQSPYQDLQELVKAILSEGSKKVTLRTRPSFFGKRLFLEAVTEKRKYRIDSTKRKIDDFIDGITYKDRVTCLYMTGQQVGNMLKENGLEIRYENIPLKGGK